MADNCNAVSDIKQIKESLSRIQVALLGDKYNPEGYLQRLAKIEAKVKTIEQRLSMVKWVAIGFGLAGTGAGAMLTKLIIGW